MTMTLEVVKAVRRVGTAGKVSLGSCAGAGGWRRRRRKARRLGDGRTVVLPV